MRKKTIEHSTDSSTVVTENFKLWKSKIQEMYESDKTIKANVNKSGSDSVSINNLSVENAKNNYYITGSIKIPRNYSNDLYVYNPIYAGLINYLSNMYLWRYTYVPRLVKDKATKTDYTEIYNLMGEVVDGISIETSFPIILSQLYINGAVYLLAVKNNSSKSISTISLPPDYCRINAITQFGTYAFQFDFSYFDTLGLNNLELEEIFNFYPKEMRSMYESYLKDKKTMRWQQMNSKFSTAISLNDRGFPTKLKALFSILQYEEYLSNELARNSQQLDKLIAHKMPTWEDKLVVDIDEMSALHSSISKVLNKNEHIKLITTFGDMEVLPIGKDETKENKTLTNAYNAIYDNSGENSAIFNSESLQSLTYGLKRDQTTTWKYVQQLVNYFNLVINNSFNFKGYQCDITMLPITAYNENEKILLYKEGATLGVTKLEYIVSTGVKQINLTHKMALEDYLNLDQLKPLSTSYTQGNSTKEVDEKVEKDNKKVEKQETVKEQEVKNNENDTE